MIIFLYGADTYSSRQRLKQLIRGFVQKYDKQALSLEHFWGDELTFGQFTRAFASSGFFTKKKLVIVENLVYQGKEPKITQAVEAYLEKHTLHEDTIVIFWEGLPGVEYLAQKKWTSNPLVKRLKTGQHAEVYNLLKPWELKSWILKEVKLQGGLIEAKAVDGLINLTCADMWLLAAEIQKLVNYRPAGVITEQDVISLCPAKADQDIFHLIDAVASRQKIQAINLVRGLLGAGQPANYLLNLLHRHFRLLLQIKGLGKATLPSIQRELRVHPFVAQKACRQAGRFTLQELKNIYQQLFLIDVRLKSSRLQPELFFDLLFIGL